MTEFTERLAGEIRAEMARQGISRRDLARLLGWSDTRTARRCSGRTRISAEDLDAIAHALGITTDDLTSDPMRTT